MSKRYVKRPLVIEALQYEHERDMFDFLTQTKDEVMTDIGVNFYIKHSHNTCQVGELYIKTLEGDMLITKGDYVIRGIKGEFYPCKKDIFEMSYEEVED